MSNDTTRAAFEGAAYDYYLERRKAGKVSDGSESPMSPQQLFWRKPEGTYGVEMFNAAWWAWETATHQKLTDPVVPNRGTNPPMKHQRDMLAQAIGNAARKAGIYNGEVGLLGPQLLMLADDMADCIVLYKAQHAVLFDGHAVLQALDEQARKRTSPESVSDVLDAVVRLMRAVQEGGSV